MEKRTMTTDQLSFTQIETKVDVADACVIFNEARASTPGLPPAPVSIDEFRTLTEGELIVGARQQNGSDELLGFISIWEPDSFIHHLYVAVAHQGQRVGPALIDKIRVQLGTPLHLKCGSQNFKAQRFYEKSGWQKGAIEIGADGPYINYCLATKRQHD